ncbi:RICIN domain-containing protein [Streptomyces sp. NBC_01142]|uniref:RICIN domain-containing protein n=1 Tax=Streptomyces sp. NBC_01142 TaxID=2975865 RepID=UPI002258F201|nr:RICIN domain-containing protein [Streptomyces sp. NBC_01142]MCX4822883.1 RICIN domain-containing protein [Streptomyces sp. NBC_01142]
MQQPRMPGTTPSAPPPRPGRTPLVSDEALAATLRAGGGREAIHPVAVLLARHRQSVFDYASLCTSSVNTASMLATAAFSQVLENLRRSRTTAALRPQLLVTARQIAKAWAADPRITALLTEVQNPGAPTENRQLISRAFQAMPGPAQVLLWHAEVEAEGISIPAGLLAIDPRTAAAQLEQARELFRAGCLRAHNELAPDQECRHYSRLLDISLRRGDTLIPDIQQHLSVCEHCRYAVEQLRHSEGRLAVLLAEGVLGGSARSYLDSRPGRRNARSQEQTGQSGPRGGTAGRHSRGGRPRALPRITARDMQPRTLLTGAGLVATGLLVVVVVASLWSGDDDSEHAGPGVPSGAISGTAPGPGHGPAAGAQQPSSPAPQQPPTSAGLPTGPLNTTLRNADSRLCLDIRDAEPVSGSEAMMAACSTAETQKWVYEQDGLLRSSAAPELCLSSHEIDGVAVLGSCTGGAAPNAGDVRYDLTIQGNVIPRWNEGLAVVPASGNPGTTVVVKVRDGSAAQRWATDTVSAAPKAQPDGAAVSPSTAEVNIPPSGDASCGAATCSPPPSPPPAGGNAAPAPAPTRTSAEPPAYDVRRVSGATPAVAQGPPEDAGAGKGRGSGTGAAGAGEGRREPGADAGRAFASVSPGTDVTTMPPLPALSVHGRDDA